MAEILIVDDDVDLAEGYRLVLESRGHSVHCEFSAADARKALESIQPDAAVLDVMMETPTAGFELARDIHAKFPELPMIMATSVHQATGVPFRFEPDETWLPVLKILDKPVNPATLAEQIEAMLAK
jgi:DNA-binding response OmpR family regulator